MILLLRAPQQRLLVLFSRRDNPQNCPFLWGSRRPTNGFLGPLESAPKRHLSRFCRAYPCDRHTDGQTERQITLCTTSVAIGRICTMRLMQPKNTIHSEELSYSKLQLRNLIS